MQVIKLGHIGLTCADLDRSARFYREIFGFEEFFRVTRDQLWIEGQTGYPGAVIEFLHMRHACGLHLELLKYHKPLAYAASEWFNDETYIPGSSHFNLWVDNIEEFTDKIRAFILEAPFPGRAYFAPRPLDLEKARITEGPQKGGTGYYMRDPDGHTIEVWQQAATKEAQGFGK